MSLEIFCIYDRPEDYPGNVIVRRWVGLTPDKTAHAVCQSIDQARRSIPSGKVRVARAPSDPKAIVESWI